MEPSWIYFYVIAQFFNQRHWLICLKYTSTAMKSTQTGEQKYSINIDLLGTVILWRKDCLPLTKKVSGRQILARKAQFRASSCRPLVLYLKRTALRDPSILACILDMFDTSTSIFFPGRVKIYKFCVSVLKTSRRRTEHRFCCLLSLLRVVEKPKL